MVIGDEASVSADLVVRDQPIYCIYNLVPQTLATYDPWFHSSVF